MDRRRSAQLRRTLLRLGKSLPRFADGRIDYTDSKVSPVVTVIVEHGGSMLVMKRSGGVGSHQHKWGAIAGYIDESGSVEGKALQEMEQEAGIGHGVVERIRIGRRYSISDGASGRRLIVYPVLVSLKRKPAVRLNWENTDYRWISPSELGSLDAIPRLEDSVRNAHL